MYIQNHVHTARLRTLLFLGLCLVAFFISAGVTHAATTASIVPTGEGNYLQMTPNAGATHYVTVDETTCNGVTDYVSETTVGERDSYAISLSTVPDGSTITQISITPCASRNTSGSGSSTLNVFYRFNGADSADAGAYALPTGTTPATRTTTNFSSLSLGKNATSTLEIGGVYTSGNKGLRLSKIAAVITYTPPAPTVVTNAASLISTTGATLNGAGNPNAVSTTGWFRYATSSPGTCNDSFGTRAPAAGGTALGSGTSSVNYAQAITSLQQNTTYYVCAIASSTSGTSFGTVQSFTTLSQPIPSVTTNAASSVAITTATLNGAANPNGATATGWFRYSSTNPGTCSDSFGTRTTGDASLGGGTSSVAYSKGITGLTGSTTYYYCALSSNSGGTGTGTVQSFTTSAQPVPTVTTGTTSSITITSATLNGAANPNGATATGWFRYSSTNPGTCNDSFGTLTASTSLGGGTTSVGYVRSISGLTANTTYYACAIASNSGGTGFGSVQSFTTLPNIPTAPSGAAAVNVSGTQNDISWTDNSSDESGFKVERRTNGGAYVQIATTSANATSYSDTSATADNTYEYSVRAYNVSGNSSYSFTNYVITATVVPNDPTALSYFTGTTSSDIVLSWSHTGSNEDGFKVERSTDNVNFSVVATTQRNILYYFDNVPTGTYYYRVYSYNAVGNSGNSNTITVIVP